MAPKSTYFHLVFIVTIVAFLSACISHLPKKWHTINEAFSADQLAGNYSQEKGFETIIFKAPYTAVWRAARVATSQSQFYIIQKNQDRGIIIAEESFVENDFRKNNFFGVRVKEIGPEQTQVTIYGKTQRACWYDLLFIGSDYSDWCKKVSTLNEGYTSKSGSSTSPLKTFIIFMENNLLASDDI